MNKFTEVFYWGSDTSGQFGIGERSIGKFYMSPKCCSFSVVIRKISCGEEHSGFIAANGYVYTMGSNQSGRLGINNPGQKHASRPVLVESLVDYQIIDISCGFSHTGVITTSGVVFTWGLGTHGALGTHETDCSWTPTKVLLNLGAKTISCGGRHTAIITENNTLYVWGTGDAGQLGTGIRQSQRLPIFVDTPKVKQVSCGVFHTLALTETGELLSTGGNSFGQLGIGTKESSSIFKKILELDGKEILKISASQHSGCITSTGEIWVWGTSTFGEFLVPNKLQCSTKVIDINIGMGFGVCVDKNGMVWSWGSNNNGCLGTGDMDSKPQPYPILELQSKIVTQISCGSGFVIALGKDLSVPELQSNPKAKSEASGSNKELVHCLEEMKKEINRLQKGSGGLEELGYKLEQSKIKQGHLHSLYLEEQRQKIHLETVINSILQEKERLKDDMQELIIKYEDSKKTISKLESELKIKTAQVSEFQAAQEKALKDKDALSVELKEIPLMLSKISKLETDLALKMQIIENMKQSSAGIANHNNILSQEIKDIPVLLNKINSLENKNNEIEKEKNNTSQELSKTLEENKQLIIKNNSIQAELDSKLKENAKLAKDLEHFSVEKLKNQELQSAIYQLENKLKSLEIEKKTVTQELSNEIHKLNDTIKQKINEIAYTKELYTEKESVSEKLKAEIKDYKTQLDKKNKINKELEEKLSRQTDANREILSGIEKELHSRAERMKNIRMPMHNKAYKSLEPSEEEDLLKTYGRND
jgi:alpha-tubulin suppressor-like RCC1 family protein